MNSFIIVMDLIINSNITLLKLMRLKYNTIHRGLGVETDYVHFSWF